MKQSKMQTARARDLRRDSTDAEKTLWSHLREKQLGGKRFRRQRPIGKYIVDFVCLESQLIVELDGGQHQESTGYDTARTTALNELGFTVIRFWNNEVLGEMDGVKEAIFRTLGR
jgi:very-short-patch-repair endonuclease